MQLISDAADTQHTLTVVLIGGPDFKKRGRMGVLLAQVANMAGVRL